MIHEHIVNKKRPCRLLCKARDQPEEYECAYRDGSARNDAGILTSDRIARFPLKLASEASHVTLGTAPGEKADLWIHAKENPLSVSLKGLRGA